MTPSEIMVKKRVIPLIYSLIYSIIHVSVMLIMMSMNGYVILGIILGYVGGFFVFSDECPKKEGEKCGGECHLSK